MGSQVQSPSYELVADEDLHAAFAKLQRAKLKGVELTRKQQQIDDDILRLEEQKRCLTTKRLIAGGQYQDWLRSVHDHTIVPYCKSWNTNYAEQIQAQLPPEVREMVFDYLWDFGVHTSSPDSVVQSLVYIDLHAEMRLRDNGAMEACSILLEMTRAQVYFMPKTMRHLYDHCTLPHYLSPDYVGSLTAIEVVQSLYKALNAASLLVCYADGIEHLLSTDVFHLGLDAVSMVRNLTVHCKVDRYRTCHPLPKDSHQCRHTVADVPYVEKRVLSRELEALLKIPRMMNLKVHILLVQRRIRLSILAEVIEAMRGVYRILRQNGASVTVIWTYRGHWPNDVVPACIRQEIISKDITTFLDMPQVAWAYNMTRFLKKVRPYIRARHWKIDMEDDYSDIKNSLDNPVWLLNYSVHQIWLQAEEELTTDGEGESDRDAEEAEDSSASDASDNE